MYDVRVYCFGVDASIFILYLVGWKLGGYEVVDYDPERDEED